MRYEDERYVRLYVRDTTTWKLLPWQAKCLLPLILRKLDRAGIADVGADATKGIAALVDVPVDFVAAALPELVGQGVFVLTGGQLVMPKYTTAQEARQSDKVRQQERRARARAAALGESENVSSNVTHRDGPSRTVTERHTESHAVTGGHTPSHEVTPYRTVPSRAEPPTPSGVGAGEDEDDRPVPAVDCSTVEHPNAPPVVPADVLIYALRRGSDGRIDAMGSPSQMIALRDLCAGMHPAPVTEADMVMLGEAWLAGAAISWCQNPPPSIRTLLAKGGEHLVAGVQDARRWQASRAPVRSPHPAAPAPPVRVVAPSLTHEQIVAKAAELRAQTPWRRNVG